MQKTTLLCMISLIFFTLFLFPQSSPVKATMVLSVGGTGEGNYTSIQQAIDQAVAGDTVLVYPGEYHEQLMISSSIQLIGLDRNTTVINASRQGDVITLAAYDISIQGFTLTGGELLFPRAAIYVTTTGNTVSDNIMTDNYYGMVLMSPASHNHIVNNHIHHNHQCGIYFSGATYNILQDNIVHHHPFNGFGLYDFSNHNHMENNVLSYNDLNGINIRDSYDNTVIQNTFTANTHGLHVPPPRFHPVVENNVFIDNERDEQHPSFFISLPATVTLLFLGLLFFKRKT